jgi:hypothetical protein
MRYLAILLVGCCAMIAAGLPSTTSADVVLYEPFDYDAGPVLGESNPSTGTSWLLAAGSGAGGATTAINVANSNPMPPAGVQPAVGNYATITGNGNFSGAANRLAFNSASTGFAADSGSTVYYSLVLRVDDVTNSNTGVGGFFFGFNNTGNAATTTNPGAVAARLQMRQDPGNTSLYNLGIVRNRTVDATNPIISWTGPLTPGDTLFLVGSIELVPGTQNDVARLWVDPSPGTFGAATPPMATLTDASTGPGIDIGIASIILRQSPAPFLSLDEIRVGDDWASVTVPETSSFLLVGGALLIAGKKTVKSLVNRIAPWS